MYITMTVITDNHHTLTNLLQTSRFWPESQARI